MGQSSQHRAVDNYRARLEARGMARFEVVGRNEDRDLIRSIARKLTEDGEEAARLRAAVMPEVREKLSTKGAIFAALQRSPLAVGDLDLTRERHEGRKIDLG